MKKLHFVGLLFYLFINTSLFSQIIISPYVVYMDEENKYGSMIVQNESYDPYEITISFVFGYPISDSLGNRTMRYMQKNTDGFPSINEWTKAFPKKFVLNPKERQTIRLMVKPPAGLKAGTYWTRIVTSSSPVEKSVDSTVSGISAKLKFVLNQVTTAMFRNGPSNTGLTIGNMKIVEDSTNTKQVLFPLKREGNSPYFGYLNLRIYNSENKIIKEERDYISIYYDLVRNYSLPNDLLIRGAYKAEIEVEFNEKVDIPESKLPKLQNILKTFDFTIQ